MPPDDALKQRTEVLKALADETRLRILSVLMERGETCVCEFAELFGTTASNLSFHLSKLRSAGLLLDRKVGKWMFYRPNPEGMHAVCEWLCPLVDPKRIPTGPACDSMAAICESGEAPLHLGEVRFQTRDGRVVVETRA
ncbi:MAG: transcriptional regulator [Armatimonadetes bacterium CG_4_9_14_3_um_filter_66_14]|nr:MAG: transcriptional regulator [Armatimonadetes bacterium CG_4_9_14_3_um_filter_66_14]